MSQSVGSDRLKLALAGLAHHCDERAQTFISAETLGEYLIPSSTPKGQRNAGHLAIAGLIHLGLVEELKSPGNAPRVLQLAWPDRMPDSSQEAPSAITSAITSAINERPSSRANVLKYEVREVLSKSLSTHVGENRSESFSEASETAESELSIRERFALGEQAEEARRLQEAERQRVREAKQEAERKRQQELAGNERRQRATSLARWLAHIAEVEGHAKYAEALACFQADALLAQIEPLATPETVSRANRASSVSEARQLLASIYATLSPALLQELRK